MGLSLLVEAPLLFVYVRVPDSRCEVITITAKARIHAFESPMTMDWVAFDRFRWTTT